MGNKKIIYYKDCDLSVGSVVNIFNRKFVLYDCDEFTKEYFRVKYGISESRITSHILRLFTVRYTLTIVVVVISIVYYRKRHS